MLYGFQIEKDTIIIPLHSPNDSPEELDVNESDSNVTKAVVHVSYEPKRVEVETTVSTKTQSDDVAIKQMRMLNEPIGIVAVDAAKTAKIDRDNVENGNENGTAKNTAKPPEDSLLSPQLNNR